MQEKLHFCVGFDLYKTDLVLYNWSSPFPCLNFESNIVHCISRSWSCNSFSNVDASCINKNGDQFSGWIYVELCLEWCHCSHWCGRNETRTVETDMSQNRYIGQIIPGTVMPSTVTGSGLSNLGNDESITCQLLLWTSVWILFWQLQSFNSGTSGPGCLVDFRELIE